MDYSDWMDWGDMAEARDAVIYSKGDLQPYSPSSLQSPDRPALDANVDWAFSNEYATFPSPSDLLQGTLLADPTQCTTRSCFGPNPDQPALPNNLGMPAEDLDVIDKIGTLDGPPGSITSTGPSLLQCVVCDEVKSSPFELRDHERAHYYVCYQCKLSFGSKLELDDHARLTAHDVYQCLTCEAVFSRLDVLKRHRLQHVPTPVNFSCTNCKKWKAPNGFKRKDHLTQHLRNYHHIETLTESTRIWSLSQTEDPNFFRHCIYEGCPMFRTRFSMTSNNVFASRSAFTNHIRKEHDKSIFPCIEPGCKRVNGKGFFRKRDLIKHLKREHDIDRTKDDDGTWC